MIGVLDSQIIEKFNEFKKQTGKYDDLYIEKVEFENIALSDEEYFEFIKGRNHYIKKYNIANKGKYPLATGSVKNDSIAYYVKPINIADIITQKCISFNKDGDSQIFYRDYEFLMDRHHIAIIPSELVLAKYLYFALISYFKKMKFGWGENVADVPTVSTHSIPIPKGYNEKYKSIDIQQAIVDFLEFWKINYTDVFRQTVTHQKPILEKIKKALIPATLRYDKTMVNSFNEFAEIQGIHVNLSQIEFHEKNINKIVDISRGQVISKNDLKQNGQYPVYSSQTKNEGLFGFIDSYMHDGDAITWTTDGKHAGTTFLRSGKFNYTNVCGLMTIKKEQDINIYYLSYMTNLIFPKYVDRTSQNSKLMTHHLNDITIPIPYNSKVDSFEIQKVLVKFWEMILNNIDERFTKFDNIERLTGKIDEAFLYRTFSKIEWREE